MLKRMIATLVMLWAAPLTAEPVSVPDGFTLQGAVVREIDALHSYRRGTPDVDEQSIIVFRNRTASLDDPQLADRIRQLLAADCSAEDVTYLELAEAPPFFRAACRSEFIAYARVFGDAQGVCIVATALREAAGDAVELELKTWITALEGCAQEAEWSS